MNSQVFSNILLPYVFALLGNISAGVSNKTSLNEINANKLPASLTIENLQLGSANERKVKTTRAPLVLSAPVSRSPPVVEDESSPIVYRLNGNKGAACILISTDGLIDFDYDTTLGEKREKPIYLPEVFETKGNCEKPDDAYIDVVWEGYKWSVFFSKTPGGEHWYVSKMELVLDQSAAARIFEHIKKAPREYKFSTPTDHTLMLFPTPVGKSYRCSDDIIIEMKDENIVAKLNLRQLKMQPFIFKKNDFGPEFVCTPGGARSYRDETAPIAVGSTLAVVTLLTVTGYGVYRYMKVKKVQYDAMDCSRKTVKWCRKIAMQLLCGIAIVNALHRIVIKQAFTNISGHCKGCRECEERVGTVIAKGVTTFCSFCDNQPALYWPCCVLSMAHPAQWVRQECTTGGKPPRERVKCPTPKNLLFLPPTG